ncbi:hypothetical protein BSZ21_02680 [Bradyrhizobium canariense]|nr:hypothetical protein BSZ21_02680 [Bradyrhizobium canariense]
MQNSAFLRVISPTKEIAVTSDNDDALAVLTREIADKVTYVQSQTILIEVLERDGHDVSDYERELTKSGRAWQHGSRSSLDCLK